MFALFTALAAAAERAAAAKGAAAAEGTAATAGEAAGAPGAAAAAPAAAADEQRERLRCFLQQQSSYDVQSLLKKVNPKP